MVKDGKSKAWLEYDTHEDALSALIRIGSGEFKHLNEEIDVGA